MKDTEHTTSGSNEEEDRCKYMIKHESKIKAANFIFSDIRDNSGIRLIYTPNLRRYDAGSLAVGHVTSGNFLVVPPHLDTFEIEGGCSSDCLGGVNWIEILHTYIFSYNFTSTTILYT